MRKRISIVVNLDQPTAGRRRANSPAAENPSGVVIFGQ